MNRVVGRLSLAHFLSVTSSVGCIALLVTLLGCTSTLALKSTPSGAEVHALGEKGQRTQLLGQTPLVVPFEGARALEITKNGFLSTYVYIPGHKSGENQSVTISLQSVSKELVEKLVKDKHPSLLDEAAYDLLELNTASTTAGRDTEMPGLIRKNEERYRKFVTFQLILGNYYFRKKDYKKSREFYEKALEIEPGNKDAKQMVKLLESSRR